jgi:hypothetical protein
MKRLLNFAVTLAAAGLLAGCQSIPPGAERGPHHTMAYDVLIDATVPGARIVANGREIGNTPLHLKIFGDPDGTFHDFGSYYYVIKAYPLTTNQFAQVAYFRTGRNWTGQDYIPSRIDFEMNLPPPPPPAYEYPPPPYYWPPYHYGWPYYGWPYGYWGPNYYWGPSVRVIVSPHPHHGHYPPH